MTEDLGLSTGPRHSLSLPNRIATLCRPLSGGGIGPGELQQPRPVLPKVQARARGWIGSGHRAFPQHAVIRLRIIQVLLDEGEALGLLPPPSGVVERLRDRNRLQGRELRLRDRQLRRKQQGGPPRQTSPVRPLPEI